MREVIGAFAAPDEIHWAPGLPKTRSGKIMRRVLRKLALPDYATQERAKREESVELKDIS